jgi:hypothetical protein
LRERQLSNTRSALDELAGSLKSTDQLGTINTIHGMIVMLECGSKTLRKHARASVVRESIFFYVEKDGSLITKNFIASTKRRG